MNRGMTLIEAVIGMAVLALISLGIAGIFKAGMQSSNYTLRQTFAVSNARKGLLGDGSRPGVVWDLRAADFVTALTTGSITLSQPGSSAITFFTASESLHRTHSGAAREQAKGVTNLGIAYYNFDDNGRVIESTSPLSAVLVTAELTMRRRGQREYRFMTGARLRNHLP